MIDTMIQSASTVGDAISKAVGIRSVREDKVYHLTHPLLTRYTPHTHKNSRHYAGNILQSVDKMMDLLGAVIPTQAL